MSIFYNDAGLGLLIIATIISVFAQIRISATFEKYSKLANIKGYTGADVAKQLLISSGINDVTVSNIAGNLTDHYDPTHKIIRLSESVFNSQSIAALSVAAHETGHAVQHNKGYMPLNIRSAIFPVVSISSRMSTPLILMGFLLTSFGGTFGYFLINIGIVMFALAVAFSIITLPVEFNASKRALVMLEDNNFLSADEIIPAKKVLGAAALTYVAAALVSVVNLIRIILISNDRRR